MGGADGDQLMDRFSRQVRQGVYCALHPGPGNQFPHTMHEDVHLPRNQADLSCIRKCDSHTFRKFRLSGSGVISQVVVPADRQLKELRLSREILEKELGRPIDTLAYPVGARDTFSAETINALRQAKYSAAFSFYTGFNTAGSIAPFDIRRCGVDQQSRKRLRLQTALGSRAGNVWF